MSSVEQVLVKQYGVLTRAQALASGLTWRQVQGRLASSVFEEVFPGVFRVSGTPQTFEQTAMAATLAAGRGAVASHRTAAVLNDFPNVARRYEATIPMSRRAIVAEGLQVHRSRLWLPGDATEVRGIPTMSALRTLFDLAGEQSPATLGGMLDHCLVNRLVRREDLEERLEALRRRRMACLPIAGLLAGLPESERPPGSTFELDLFRALDRAGVERPVAQFRVVMPDGTERFIDFAYPRIKLGLEASSFTWHGSRTHWERDHARNNELIALGWRLLLLPWGMLRHHPDQLVDLVRRARAELGAA